MTMTKVCFRCDKEKPLSEFYSHPETADGHFGKCKECTKRDVRENYAKRRAQYSEYERKRCQGARRKEYAKEYQRRRRARDPEKYRAHTAVNNAIRDGRLVRQPCEVCGNPKSQAHHDDYSKPLEVRWLCFRCHREAHGQTVATNNPDYRHLPQT